ncbi:MAG: TRM11 family SAM-dependent methyltransferase, partial [Anaerolineae bacterium]
MSDKESGVSDPQIGERYGVSFGTLEQIITEAYGANISVLKRSKRIKRWQPPNFREKMTTVWSFKQRGDWATHDGRYRGNWSPYIPRNVILKYSRPGDIVLDYFVGGGTTAVEAKLLGRRCIARDINPGAVGITLENLRFSPPQRLFGDGLLQLYEPEVSVGDARDLADLPDNSVDLICAHPPYAGIIQYSTKIAGDLSNLSVQNFLVEMRKVAKESFRVLKPGGKCAILIGDARKSKHIMPIGFETIRVFLDAGFVLRELVIKRQHNCKTTGFWYTRSIQYNFLL